MNPVEERDLWRGDAGPFRLLFDAVPQPMLVVDDDVVILALNRAGEPLFGAESEVVLRRRGGDALRCVNHFESPSGCGHAHACRTCVVRTAVGDAHAGGRVHRQLAKMELKGPSGVTPVHLCVTASPFEVDGVRRVLLVLEDVSDLTQIEALLPICAWCKKVRSGESYWEAVDRYLVRKANAEFTHCICDECLAKRYPAGPDEQGAVAPGP